MPPMRWVQIAFASNWLSFGWRGWPDVATIPQRNAGCDALPSTEGGLLCGQSPDMINLSKEAS